LLLTPTFVVSQHIVHALQARGVQKWVALSEGQGGSIGWLTTNERKEVRTHRLHVLDNRTLLTPYIPVQAMVFQLRDALSVGNISLSDQFFSVCMDEHEAIKAIRDELCRFAIITEPAKTLFGKVRRTYTGKIGGQQDDLAICLCVATPFGHYPFYTTLFTCANRRILSVPLTKRRQLAITGLRCFYQSAKYSNFRQEL
jgi:hypothetical protein